MNQLEQMKDHTVILEKINFSDFISEEQFDYPGDSTEIHLASTSIDVESPGVNIWGWLEIEDLEME